MPEVDFQFRYNKASLQHHIDWMRYLATNKFGKDVQQDYEETKNQVEMLKEVDKIILEEIYSYPEGSYRRTNDLRESFQAIELSMVGSETERGIAIYSDPMIAPSEAGARKGEISYAIFFENPEFNTFLPESDERPPIRPYFGLLQDAIKRIAEHKLLEALARQMKTHAKHRVKVS